MVHTRVSQKNLQYFGNLFALFFNLQKKSSLAFKVEAVVLYHLKPPFCQFLFKAKKSFTEVLPLLGCWSIVSTGSVLLIGTRNNPRDLGLDYMLGVASVRFCQILGVYSRLFEWGLALCFVEELTFC